MKRNRKLKVENFAGDYKAKPASIIRLLAVIEATLAGIKHACENESYRNVDLHTLIPRLEAARRSWAKKA